MIFFARIIMAQSTDFADFAQSAMVEEKFVGFDSPKLVAG